MKVAILWLNDDLKDAGQGEIDYCERLPQITRIKTIGLSKRSIGLCKGTLALFSATLAQCSATYALFSATPPLFSKAIYKD